MLHTRFRGNRPAGSGDFIGFLPYMGMVAILVMCGHVTSIMSSDFHFLVSESFHKQVAQRATMLT